MRQSHICSKAPRVLLLTNQKIIFFTKNILDIIFNFYCLNLYQRLKNITHCALKNTAFAGVASAFSCNEMSSRGLTIAREISTKALNV